MDRKSFTQKLALLGVCPIMIKNLASTETLPPREQDEKYTALQNQKQFVENWLADLLESMEKNLDRPSLERIVGECGKACFNRHQFKKDIALNSEGNLEKLMENYKKNFEIWRDGNFVHIRFGEVSKQCYCPAAYYRPAKENDIHCECTRNTHKAIFETALNRSFDVKIVESLRRGGKTCHFIVNLNT